MKIINQSAINKQLKKTHKPSRLAMFTKRIRFYGLGEKSKPMLKLRLRPHSKIDKHCNHNASGNVPNANWDRDNRQANLDRNDSRNSNSNNGARAEVKDYVLRDLNQPPSIRPISDKLLWVWKILVSLAISISKKSRSFKVDISKWLPALIR